MKLTNFSNWKQHPKNSWVDLKIDEIKDVFAYYHINEELKSDIRENTEKILNFKNYFYLSIDIEDYFLHFIVSKDFLITIHQKEIQEFEKIEPKSPEFILYQFLDYLADEWTTKSKKLMQKVENLDEKNIENIRSEVIESKRYLLNKQKLIQTLRRNPILSNQIKNYFKDIQDHISISLKRIQFSKDILFDISEPLPKRNESETFIYLVQAFGFVILPFVVICGIFGMNVPVPFGDSDSLVPFFVISGIIVSLSILIFIILLLGMIIAGRKK